MVKLDLEKELLSQNKRIATPKELLLIKEYETHTNLVHNDALARLGLNETVKTGKLLKEEVDFKKKETFAFDQNRVFHISQIKSICEKYHLKFLPIRYYNGRVDVDLPKKIVHFEAAYNVRCNLLNTRIIAPKESFKLEERPRDPLMFYEINSEYFYLIHKWGTDLNVTRRLLPILSSLWATWLLLAFVLPLPVLFFGNVGQIIYAILSGVTSLYIGVFNTASFDESDKIRLVKKCKWNSHFND